MARRPIAAKRHRRAVLSFDGSSTGDFSAHDIAGRDITRIGIAPEPIIALLQESVTDEKHARRLQVSVLEMIEQKQAHMHQSLRDEIRLAALVLAVLILGAALVLGIVIVRV